MGSFSKVELVIMQEAGDSFLLLWAGTVCNATSRFLHRWYEEATGIEKRRRKTILYCKKGKLKQEFRFREPRKRFSESNLLLQDN